MAQVGCAVIWAFIPGPIKRFMAWALAGLVAFGLLLASLKRQWAVARDLRAAKAKDAAHERITDAETDLSGVHSDADRVRRLADYARKHGA